MLCGLLVTDLPLIWLYSHLYRVLCFPLQPWVGNDISLFRFFYLLNDKDTIFYKGYRKGSYWYESSTPFLTWKNSGNKVFLFARLQYRWLVYSLLSNAQGRSEFLKWSNFPTSVLQEIRSPACCIAETYLLKGQVAMQDVTTQRVHTVFWIERF